ncbi:MAG: hypothetical protein AB7F86_17510 [Bdellovibrionales bacterium]
MKKVGWAMIMAMGLSAGPMSVAQEGPKECLNQAISTVNQHIRNHEILRDSDARNTFSSYINCASLRKVLDTAFHEAVHGYTTNKRAYPLVAGGSRPTLEDDKSVLRFFQPSTLKSEFGNSHNISYLQVEYKRDEDTGKMVPVQSSANNFGALLDEFNAYTNQLAFETSYRSGVTSSQTGLTSLMSFVAAYLRKAKETSPSVWRDLQSPEKRKTLQLLWNQAESVLARACSAGLRFDEDPGQFYQKYLCDAQKMSGVGSLLNKASICPTAACLGRPAPTELAQNEVEDSSPAAPTKPAGGTFFWLPSVPPANR